jgi:sugar phosphate isomerase/epimerase
MEPPKLIASYMTVAGAVAPLSGSLVSPLSFRERASAAAKAGYNGIGLMGEDISHCLRTLSYTDIRTIIADAGLEAVELEFLDGWFADGEERRQSDAARRFLLQAAEHLAPLHIKVVCDQKGRDWPFDHLIESFAGLCRDAAFAGTAICVEMLPYSTLRDLKTARALIAGANASNGGLLLDVFHLGRGGTRYEELLEIAPQEIRHVELDDAAAAQIGTYMEDTVLRRKLPGEGALDVRLVVSYLRAIGYQGWYGVEIISEEHASRPIQDAANLSFRAALAQFT